MANGDNDKKNRNKREKKDFERKKSDYNDYIEKVQRPEPWPDPPDEKQSDKDEK